MIFYFSGTGNSAWVARQLAEGQNEELLSIAMEIDRNKAYKLKEGEKVGFVFPVYACIIRKSKFPPNPERSVQFSGKRTKRSVQKKGCTQHL